MALGSGKSMKSHLALRNRSPAGLWDKRNLKVRPKSILKKEKGTKLLFI